LTPVPLPPPVRICTAALNAGTANGVKFNVGVTGCAPIRPLNQYKP